MDPSLIPSPPSETAKEWARAFAGMTITLNIIALLVFGGRLYTRCVPTFRLNADDYVISIAWLLIVLESVFLLLTVPFVLGRDPSTITLQDLENSSRYAVIAQPLWAWGMAAIKDSIALMLLRLETNIHLRRFLWANMTLQVVLALYNMIAQLLQCFPLHKVWDLLGVVPGRCWSAEAVKINLICQSAIIVATDLIFALMPISFLRKVQRPIRERVVIGGLMALGVLASAASIAKMQASLRLTSVGDATAVGIQVGMWSAIEELIAFICACVPCLRSPFQRALRYLGIISTQKTTYAGGYYNMGAQSTPMRGSRTRTMGAGTGTVDTGSKGIRMKSLRSTNADADSDEIILSNEEIRNGEIWCTTEVQVEDQIRLPGAAILAQQDAQSSWSDHSPVSESRPKRKEVV
ncbi:hypothetical protein N0V90_001327 [Kalmusia sp. IMI 367209]|nr:hypothetical protein N0V90_001327 [Kalmusia sp. IMI 367209]